jgi:hypothetical protein
MVRANVSGTILRTWKGWRGIHITSKLMHPNEKARLEWSSQLQRKCTREQLSSAITYLYARGKEKFWKTFIPASTKHEAIVIGHREQ